MDAASRRPVLAAPHYPGQVIMFARQAPGLAALVGLALFGLGLSIYLTTVHYAGVPLYCSASGIINCGQVTRSVYSMVPGTQVPITIPGMLWFLVSSSLAVLAWQARERGDEWPARIWLTQIVWSVAGMLSVLYLVFIELVVLHHICEWCTGVHVVILLSFIVTLARPLPVAAADEEDVPLDRDVLV